MVTVSTKTNILLNSETSFYYNFRLYSALKQKPTKYLQQCVLAVISRLGLASKRISLLILARVEQQTEPNDGQFTLG